MKYIDFTDELNSLYQTRINTVDKMSDGYTMVEFVCRIPVMLYRDRELKVDLYEILPRYLIYPHPDKIRIDESGLFAYITHKMYYSTAICEKSDIENQYGHYFLWWDGVIVDSYCVDNKLRKYKDDDSGVAEAVYLTSPRYWDNVRVTDGMRYPLWNFPGQRRKRVGFITPEEYCLPTTNSPILTPVGVDVSEEYLKKFRFLTEI